LLRQAALTADFIIYNIHNVKKVNNKKAGISTGPEDYFLTNHFATFATNGSFVASFATLSLRTKNHEEGSVRAKKRAFFFLFTIWSFLTVS